MIVFLYSLDGWFFGYHNTKLRRRYAKLFCCRSQRLEPSEADAGGCVGAVRAVQQRGQIGSAGPARAERLSQPPSKRAGAAGTGTLGTIWVVPRLPQDTIGEIAVQAQLTSLVQVLPKVQEADGDGAVPNRSVQLVDEVKAVAGCSAGSSAESGRTLTPQLQTCDTWSMENEIETIRL